jgi:hypothetical protein
VITRVSRLIEGKLMKKTLSVLISALLAFAGLTAITAPAQATDRTVTIHYHRFDGNYGEWNLWIWGSGTGYDNTGDHIFSVDETKSKFPATYTFTFPESTSGFGFVLRDKNCWGCGEVKDGGDHSAALAADTTDVWVVEGSDTAFYSEPAFPQAVDSPKPGVKLGKMIALDKRTDKGALVTWTSKTKKVCSVVSVKGKPKLKGLKKGLCRVKAVAVSVGEYGAYSKTVAVYVN